MKKTQLILIIIASFNFSCESEDFYSTFFYRGNPRIPMIKPYVVKSNDSGNNWSIDLKSVGVPELKQIGVKDSVFVVYSDDAFAPGFTKHKGPTWFIVNMATDTDIACDSKIRYREIIDSLGVPDLELYNVNYVFDLIVEEDRLPPEWPQKENR